MANRYTVSSETTTSTTVTGPVEGTTVTKVVTSIAFKAPDRTCYYSHDSRNFSFDSGNFGLKGMNVKISYFYQTVYEDGTTVTAETPYEVKDVTADCKPLASQANPKVIYETGVYKYDLEIYLANSVKVGTHRIYIGVKGDVTLDGVADADDASAALKYYTAVLLDPNTDYLLRSKILSAYPVLLGNVARSRQRTCADDATSILEVIY